MKQALIICLILAATGAAQAQGPSSVMVTPSSVMTTPSSVMTTPSLAGAPVPVRYQAPVNDPQPWNSYYYYGGYGYGYPGYGYPGSGYRPDISSDNDDRGSSVGGRTFRPNTFSPPRF